MTPKVCNFCQENPKRNKILTKVKICQSLTKSNAKKRNFPSQKNLTATKTHTKNAFAPPPLCCSDNWLKPRGGYFSDSCIGKRVPNRNTLKCHLSQNGISLIILLFIIQLKNNKFFGTSLKAAGLFVQKKKWFSENFQFLCPAG